MSCWVVPSLAAELWRMPLEQVLKLVREGTVPTKQEEGFTFIDVAPNSPKMGPTFLPAAGEDDVDVLVVDSNEELIDEASADFGDWRAARARVSLTRIGPPSTRRKSA